MVSQSSSSRRYSCPVSCESMRRERGHGGGCWEESERTHLIDTEERRVAAGDGIGDVCISASIAVRGYDVDEG